MSMGYIPKKRLKQKRMRKLRKKYNNFSCSTCDKAELGKCTKMYIPTPPIGLIVSSYENCNEWKAKR